MRIAKNDAGTHADELVDEEHSRLEHLFVHHDHAFALCCSNDSDRHDVGRERGPGLILELWNVSTEIALDLLLLLGGDNEIIALGLAFDAQPSKAQSNGAEVLDAGVGNA